MKKLLLLVLTILALVSSSIAQTNDPKYGVGAMPIINGKVTFSEVVSIKDVPTSRLYDRAKLAVVNMFNSAKDVIQLEDKEAGVLIVKGVNQYQNESIYAYFTLKMYFKDGRYKADITDCVCEVLPSNAGVSPRKYFAEALTDELCLNNKGEIRRLSPGFDRRFIIDTKDYIFSVLNKKMNENIATQNEDW